MLLRKNAPVFLKNVSPLSMSLMRKLSDSIKSGEDCRVFEVPSIREIGCREIVGHGRNGDHAYADHPAFPFPAVHFREITTDLLVSSVYNNYIFLLCNLSLKHN